MDAALNRVPGIILEAGSGTTIYSAYCGHVQPLTYGTYVLDVSPEIDYSGIASVSAGFDSPSCKIKNIPAPANTLAGYIYDRFAYNKVKVLIYEFEVNDSFAIVNARLLFKGFLYKAKSYLGHRYLDIEAREIKYYFDKTAGVVCTEQCAARFYGDKICGKTKTSVSGVVQSITGTVLTLTGIPAGANYIYNNGFITGDNLNIKIAYWKDGASFNLISTPPASWVGRTVSISVGCDRTLSTCKNIHNNEANFFGLGYSMVAYNAVYEET